MSGRGGIYKGPGGELLHGDGKPVGSPESSLTAPAGSESGLSVTIVEHPNGFLMRLEHDGATMTLDRAEAFDLNEKLSAKLGAISVKP